MEFLKSHFDKFLLAGIFLALVCITIHLIHDGANIDAATVNWAEDQAGTVLGALLTLITGAVLRGTSKTESDKDKTP